jgi:hypothetical protein
MSNILKTLAAGSVSGDYQISRSLRFNSADSAYLSRTPASAGDRKTWTWSGWVKRSQTGANNGLFTAGTSFGVNNNDLQTITFTSSDTIELVSEVGGATQYRLITTQVFRDPSSWYHVLVAFDTTQATSSDSVKLYINGVQVTAFGTATYPSPNYDGFINSTNSHRIGQRVSIDLNGYMTEVNFIDGQALTPSSFGETNATTGVWSPIKFNGPWNVGTGVNGFYLNFSDNSGVTSTTLGKDQAGSNNWTPSGSPGFSVTAGAGNDSLVDTPTQYGTDTGAGGEVGGNYCTWNPLANLGLTLSNGNLTNAYTTALWTGTSATLAMDSGKWYFEYTVNATGAYTQIGVITVGKPLPTGGLQLQNGTTFAWGYQTYGVVFHAGSETSSGITSATTNDVISVAVDIDAGKIWIGKNGTFFNSGNPAAGTNAAYTNLSGAMIPVVFSYGTESGDTNFGQRPFAYTAPSGFKALVTTNLPEPTVVQGDDYFNTVLYTGDGAASRSITGVGFQPDFSWLKTRSNAYPHALVDAVRGATNQLRSNGTNAEYSGGVSSFNSDGFAVNNNYNENNTGMTYVGWNWKADGAGVSNGDGTITSTVTVSANTIAGISIVTYTGTGVVGATVGHGLGAVPAMMIVKSRSAASNWLVYHKGVASDPQTDYLTLETTNAVADNAGPWNDTAPTSSVFTIGDTGWTNTNTATYIAYCFAEVEGFSKFGSYTGNGSADGPFVYTGFRPAFVLTKRTDSTSNWVVQDTSRSPFNPTNVALIPNGSFGDQTGPWFDILSNGFKVRNNGSDTNGTGPYIYMAFAENPFKYSLAR